MGKLSQKGRALWVDGSMEELGVGWGGMAVGKW